MRKFMLLAGLSILALPSYSAVTACGSGGVTTLQQYISAYSTSANGCTDTLGNLFYNFGYSVSGFGNQVSSSVTNAGQINVSFGTNSITYTAVGTLFQAFTNNTGTFAFGFNIIAVNPIKALQLGLDDATVTPGSVTTTGGGTANNNVYGLKVAKDENGNPVYGANPAPEIGFTTGTLVDGLSPVQLFPGGATYTSLRISDNLTVSNPAGGTVNVTSITNFWDPQINTGVPEPASMLLVGGGLLVAGLIRRRVAR